MNKRYTVISVPTKDGPTYRIYDRINQCSIEGGFDTEKWAESVAEMMEEKYAEDKGNHKATRRAGRTRHEHQPFAEESAEDCGRVYRESADLHGSVNAD